MAPLREPIEVVLKLVWVGAYLFVSEGNLAEGIFDDM